MAIMQATSAALFLKTKLRMAMRLSRVSFISVQYERLDYRDGSYLLEGKAQDCDALARDGVEHRLDDALHEPLLLVVVDLNHLRGSIWQW